MKYRILWRWSLGVNLTILSFLIGHLQTPARASDGSAASAVQAGAESPAPEDASVADAPPEADLANAPAKPVSTSKPLPGNIAPSGPVSEVIKLANSGLSESVMLAFVTNSTATFNLGAEEIIYLNDIGVPGSVVTAMIQRDQVLKTSLAGAYISVAAGNNGPASNSEPAASSPPADQVAPQPIEPETAPGAPVVEAPLAPPAQMTDDGFYDSLSPYGTWLDVEGYGSCWQPTVVAVNPTWQPYFDCGHWVYSDCGWYWLSDYSWGWAPFHYGRWFQNNRFGWCWAPGRVWGPSWVSWRYNNDFCGWAPLPPGAYFTAGFGLSFHGRHVGDHDDFGLRPGNFHFVAWDHFHDRQLHPHSLPPQQVAQIYPHSTAATRIIGDGRTVINNGLPPSRVEAATHTSLRTVALRNVTVGVPTGGRVERFEPNGQTLAVYRPSLSTTGRPLGQEPEARLHRGAGGVSGQPVLPTAASSPRQSLNSSLRTSSIDSRTEDMPIRPGQPAPLVMRGAQSSSLKEAVPPNSLVVIGKREPNPALFPNRSFQPAETRPITPTSSIETGAPSSAARSAPAMPAPATTAVRSVPSQASQRSWMGTTSSSPQPSWFGAREAGPSPRPIDRSPAYRQEAPSYQPPIRSAAPEVPRYSPTPAYAPQRSYSAPPAVSAPERAPSFESRPAPPAPSAPAASSAGSHSHSSDRNGR